MNKKAEERRRNLRYVIRDGFRVIIAPSLLSTEMNHPVEGILYDVSYGGVSIMIPETVVVHRPMLCQFWLNDLPVPITTLTHVRWMAPFSLGLRVGLQFLLPVLAQELPMRSTP